MFEFTKKVSSNLLVLGSSNVLNFLVPLLLTPYFVNILGTKNFGVTAISFSLMMILNIIIDYHFTITGVKLIARNKSQIILLNKLFNDFFFTRLILLIPSFFILLAVSMTYSIFFKEKLILFTSFTIVIANALSPNWFFQGVNDFKAVGLFNAFSKVTYLILCLLCIEDKEDSFFPNFLLGLSNLLIIVISLIYIKKNYTININMPQMASIYEHLKIGRFVLLSNLSINSYTSLSPFILGLYLSPIQVGCFAIAEKVLNVSRQFIGVFIQVVYPIVCDLFLSKLPNLKPVKMVFFFFSCFSIIWSGLVFYFSFEISFFFSSEFAKETGEILRVFSIIPLIISVINLWPYIVLNALDYEKLLSKILLFASLLNLFIMFLLSFLFQIIGAAIAMVLAELIVGLLILFFYSKITKKLIK